MCEGLFPISFRKRLKINSLHRSIRSLGIRFAQRGDVTFCKIASNLSGLFATLVSFPRHLLLPRSDFFLLKEKKLFIFDFEPRIMCRFPSDSIRHQMHHLGKKEKRPISLFENENIEDLQILVSRQGFWISKARHRSFS